MSSSLSSSELAWLRCFNAAAQFESFTKAAHELNVSQGAVSQQVKKLEDRLSCPLLLRTPSGLVLTPQGEQLFNATQVSFHTLQDAMRLVKTPTAAKTINVSCTPSLAMLWLTLRLESFYREHQNLSLSVHSETEDIDYSHMSRDGVALAVRLDSNSGGSASEAILMDEWILPVAVPAFLNANPDLKSLDDLKPSHLIHGADPINGMLPTLGWRRWLHAAGVALPAAGIRQGTQFNLSLLAIQAALGGQGIAMARVAYVLHYLEQGRLVVPFPHRFQLSTNYHAYGSISHPEMPIVMKWLMKEAAKFKTQRDAYFDAAGITPIGA